MQLSGPIFYSSDVAKAVEFYKTLGLRLVNLDGSRFAMFEFADGKQLGVKQEEGGREKPGSQTMMIKPTNINTSYKDMKEKGIEVVRELTTEDYGTTFIVSDPDGNWIEFID